MEENNTQIPNSQEIKAKSPVWDFVKYAIVALAIVIPFRIYVAQPYVVSGSSMDPTFKDADYLIVDQISKRFEETPRGSVVIIKYPVDPSKFFIKRLIGFPGDTIEIKNGKVLIFNKINPEGRELKEPYVVYPKTENFKIELADDQYFVMGDNRAGSSDSRIWGAVPKKYIIGRPFVRLFPVNKIEFWPGIF